MPFAGEVAWLEWWTKSSARELLLGSGVGSARANCAETFAAAGVVRGNPETTPAPAAADRSEAGCSIGRDLLKTDEFLSLTEVNCQALFYKTCILRPYAQ